MNFINYFREKISDWLKIEPATNGGVSVIETYDHPTGVFINKIWYRGDARELSQLYKQLDLGEETFWEAECSPGQDMRKLHTGLPRLIVNALTNISIDDLSSISFEKDEDRELWEQIEKENSFSKQLKNATKNVLALGDGAFKISFDNEVSQYPIIEFYAADDVEYKCERGRIREVIFYTKYDIKNKKKCYTLQERYGYGYIKYKMLDEYNREVSLDVVRETEGLEDVEFDKSLILAVPYIIYDSEKFKGRGQSIFEGKHDSFDALDESFSQWMDALRTGKTKTYIPEILLPRDPTNGSIKKYNPFDTRYTTTGTDLSENASNHITTTGGNIQVDVYIQTYCTSLDLCLQGIISPSTLGIDVKKLDNGEAQREKEKMTLYTRNSIIEAVTDVIESIVHKCFNMLQLQHGAALNAVDPSFSFGEYANPSFESVVETMSNPNSPMSIEAKVEELWGDSKDEEWKAAEVSRIKSERGIIELPEPAIGMNVTL
jgi:hypothetical protein